MTPERPHQLHEHVCDRCGRATPARGLCVICRSRSTARPVDPEVRLVGWVVAAIAAAVALVVYLVVR